MNTAGSEQDGKGRGFSGYHQAQPQQADPELTRTGPGTACGEYLRRFWQPVAMTQDLGDRPLPLRILGEDLVLFRDGGGTIGLVHRQCPHRRASLEYGKCETRGIRCCYHGWLFAADGTILETPSEPADSIGARKLRESLRLGAYPVEEYRGLVFAYLGPPEEIPPFPVYDTYLIPDLEMVPYKAPFDCNWLQVLDAILDPVHTSFLHCQNSRVQFSEGIGEVGELVFHERAIQLLASNVRRVGDNVWVRVNELILPNFTQAGAAFAADGTKSIYFGRSAFTRWVVPVDDTHCIAYAWANFGERGDPPEWNNAEGPQLIEQGELFDRSDEERRQRPGDLEAVEGMGPINIHAEEHLLSSDKGVALMRRRLRRACRDLAAGKGVTQPTALADGPIRTYGQDSVLTLPADQDDDRVFLRNVEAAVMNLQFAAEDQELTARDETIIAQLIELESRGLA